jgi:predicted dienelactone hydrolase
LEIEMKILGLIIAALLALAPGAVRAANVGFQEIQVANGADTPLRVGIWYPTDAPAAEHRLEAFTQTVAPDGPVTGRGLALVVMSHGNGGWYGEHYDTALALARAGFVVAAVSHTGDTYADQSRSVRMVDRPMHIKRLIDYMTAEWFGHDRIDAGRIGVFGFSSGGFTALVAAGGAPDMSGTAAHCRAHPGYYDCQLLKKAGVSADTIVAQPRSAWTHDARIKAAVVAAPALGYAFGREGLKDIHVPVQLWRAEDDHILPNPDYAEAVRSNLPSPPEFHLVSGADHFDFLAPCSDQLARSVPMICHSAPGFDRAAFHARFNEQVAGFFRTTLK